MCSKKYLFPKSIIIQVNKEIICNNNFTILNKMYSILPKICLRKCSIVEKQDLYLIHSSPKSLLILFSFLIEFRCKKECITNSQGTIRQNKNKSQAQYDLFAIQIGKLGHQF